MAPKKNEDQLTSPLIFGTQPDYAGAGVSDGHIQADAAVPVDGKLSEYQSRAKARAANTFRVCGIPFSILMLACIMVLTFGSYWSYDIPGSIETQLMAWFGDSYTDASNSLLYSIYSWPNCILAFFGGFILDKITGVRKGAMLFCGLIALGQLIFAFGCQYKVYYLALFGRFVFGLGGENLTVAQNTYTVRWFDGKRLALAFGLVVAFSRIGTSVNFVVSPILASSPITFQMHQYAQGACDAELPLPAGILLSGPINECAAGRLVNCTALESDAFPTFQLYAKTDRTCTNHTLMSVPVSAPGTCILLPAPLNATYPAAKLSANKDTNEFEFLAFTNVHCEGVGLTVYGQGNGCSGDSPIDTMGGSSPLLLGYNYRMWQDVTAPCFVQEFEDSACQGREVNRWGMDRDKCVVPTNPTRAPYKFTINPGTGVPITVWFGMGMCALSFCACIAAAYCDWWGEKKVESEREVFFSTLTAEEVAHVRKLDEMNEPTSDDISLKMVKRIPALAWLLFIITAVFYVAILNFYQVASVMMQHTGKHISAKEAGIYMAIPNLVAIVGSPLGGFTVDKFGRALVFIAIACCMLICAHVYFLALAYGWLVASPIPVMLWLGVTYSLGASCLWPILAFIVEKEALGTGYGCMTSVQNLFLAIAAVVIGQLQDWAKKAYPDTVLQYSLPIMVFIGCAAIALLCTILLIFMDRARGGRLNASASERAAILAADEAAQDAKNAAMREDSKAALLGTEITTSESRKSINGSS